MVALMSASCYAVRLDGLSTKAVVFKKIALKGKRIPCWKNVEYSVVNSCDWNSRLHPRDYPDTAQWSPLCGTTHNSAASVFKIGGISTDGVKQVAEEGDCSTLQSEVTRCAEAGYCGDFLSYQCSAVDGTCKHEGTFYATKRYPYLSMMSMAAPSPDWFVGVDSVPLCKNGYWLPSYEKYLLGNDAGTDAGPTFLSDNMPMAKREPIAVFDGKDRSNIFYNDVDGELNPLCKITVTLKST